MEPIKMENRSKGYLWTGLVIVLLAGYLLGACGDSTATSATSATTAATSTTSVAATTQASTTASATTSAAGTTSAPATTAAATAGLAATASTTGKSGGTAVIAIDADPETLNLGTTTGYSAGDVGAKIYNGLVWIGSNFQPQPSLATSWTISPDGKTYTFKLRQGVTWHDGQTFSSDDVKFTFEQILAKFHPRTQTLMKRVKSIETPDANTVVMTLTDPYAPFLLQMSVFDAPILPKHLYENTDILKNPYNSKPVGTGPFKFGEWKRGTSLTVVKNDKYWDQGKPYLDSIIFQIVPQGANRSTGLETGEIDFVVDYYLAKADVSRLTTNNTLQSKRGQGTPAIDFMTMNTKTPALSTKEARQAVALVVDRQRLVDQAMGGFGRVAKGPFGDGFKWLLDPASDYTTLYPKDLAKAKSLLATAGVTGGTLRLVYDSARPQFVAGGQIIKENLQQLGFTVELQPLERSAMLQKVFTNRDYDLTLQSFSSSGDPSIGYHRLYLTNTTTTQFLNASGYSNTTVDGLLNKAAVTADQSQRAELYKQADAILAVDLPSLVLFDEEGVDFATKKLAGLWLSTDSRDRWDNVSQS